MPSFFPPSHSPHRQLLALLRALYGPTEGFLVVRLRGRGRTALYCPVCGARLTQIESLTGQGGMAIRCGRCHREKVPAHDLPLLAFSVEEGDGEGVQG